MNRKQFLQTSLGGLGTLLFSPVALTKTPNKAKSVIQIFLWGGMSHNDTWDYKDTGYEYTGGVKGLKSNKINGFSEWFPDLAEQSDKFSVIRSMTHRNFGHETAAYMMQTGHVAGERLAYPSIGAIVALYLKKQGYHGILDPYIVLTQPQGRFSEAGFLGSQYKPFATGGDPNNKTFEVEGIVSKNVNKDRQKARKTLAESLDIFGKTMSNNQEVKLHDDTSKQAWEVILGKGAEIFDLSKEKDDIRDKYGRNTFGQDCVAARRLVEAGVPYIVINYPAGWDTHKDHFQTMRRQTQALDQGLAFLFKDLANRGLLESTIVWVTGEFGRTPKVDWQPPWNGGRGHYGNVFSVIVGGGGFKGGAIVGSSDATCSEPKERPVYPVDLLGSIYKLIGIEANMKLPHPLGLNAYVLPQDEEAKKPNLLTEIM